MKTKVFKSVLPIIAVVFAMGLAFATETTNSSPAFYDDPAIPGVQRLTGGTDCPTVGQIPCMYQDFQLFADEDLSTPLFIKKQ
ncbi:DUF6520 family protein [Gelidibacter salicanalis]|uniref:Secreted protein n=1 Tax=Gelidibacter salicanalis TaxID=291193 RepID=A0A934KTB2_9FLAO|nr:DUF6520 family protein [Gelidibacter salicanalis]MBJ7880976.1 hypothetical protein [Gelidibacter salicanalis]